MQLGTGIGMAFFALRLQRLTRRENFYMEQIIADEGHHFAVRIQRILAEHGPRREPDAIPQFAQDELDGLFLRGHDWGGYLRMGAPLTSATQLTRALKPDVRPPTLDLCTTTGYQPKFKNRLLKPKFAKAKRFR